MIFDSIFLTRKLTHTTFIYTQAVKPNATRAVLFYSQFPNGEIDPYSFHGGCPVLKGTKLAANLWTWSAIRPEYPGGPQKRALTAAEQAAQKQQQEPEPVLATFTNSGQDPRFDEHTKVYYGQETFFGNLAPTDPAVRVNTYPGHVWRIVSGDVLLKEFEIPQGGPQRQDYVV